MARFLNQSELLKLFQYNSIALPLNQQNYSLATSSLLTGLCNVFPRKNGASTLRIRATNALKILLCNSSADPVPRV